MNILMTGITGFIGGHVGRRLLESEEHRVVALVRPGTDPQRYANFTHGVCVLEMDLTDSEAIDAVFAKEHVDCVLHIAAVRGGGSASHEEFERSNIQAPMILAHAARQQNAHFLFCSSVGVFGTIPQQLPPTEDTLKVGDNYYHYTKIEAERRLLELQQQGLRLTIIRPIITYGPGDRGFPFQLIHLTAQGLLLLPTRDIRIHMVDVQSVVDAFVHAATLSETCGKIYTVTDPAPVSLRTLVQYIVTRLSGQRYPAWKVFPTPLLRLAEFGLEHVVKSDLWLTRVKLMSRDWAYDGSLAAQELRVRQNATIPNFSAMIEWYRSVLNERP